MVWLYYAKFCPLFIDTDTDTDTDIDASHQIRFNALIAQLIASYQRLTDQHQAALDKDGIVLWVDSFKQQKLAASCEALIIDKQLFGWVLKVGC